MASNMVVHCGGKIVSLEELDQYPVPEVTDTYKPIPHRELAEYIKTTAAQLIGRKPCRESYAVTKDGARMFGLQVFGDDSVKCSDCNGRGSVEMLVLGSDTIGRGICSKCSGTGWAPNEYGFAIAHRSSYDKSISVGIAAGFNVFVCDNLAITGEIKILRKHTKNVWEHIDMHLLHALVRKRPELEERFHNDVGTFKHAELNVHDGYRMLGLLMGNQILMPTQVNVALNEWNQAANHESQMSTAWQFYNSCTVALKSTPPHKVLEKHRDLHQVVLQELN